MSFLWSVDENWALHLLRSIYLRLQIAAPWQCQLKGIDRTFIDMPHGQVSFHPRPYEGADYPNYEGAWSGIRNSAGICNQHTPAAKPCAASVRGSRVSKAKSGAPHAVAGLLPGGLGSSRIRHSVCAAVGQSVLPVRYREGAGWKAQGSPSAPNRSPRHHQ